MKLERILAILVLLLHRGKVTAQEMCDQFEVSRRTIYRDMEVLSAAGFPIVSYAGKDGGFALLDTYKLDRFTFSTEERQQLTVSLQAVQELLGEKETALVKAKLELLERPEPEGKLPIFSLSEATLHRSAIEQETRHKLDRIRGILQQAAGLEFDYIAASGDRTKRKVQPLQLQLKNGSWYLEAWCSTRRDTRSFKLTRMARLDIIDREQLKSLSWMEGQQPIAERKSQSSKQQSQKPDDLLGEQVRLVFARSQLGKLVDFFLEQELQEQENGEIEVTLEHDHPGSLIPFLLMFGSHVRVKAPKWLQERYHAEVAAMYTAVIAKKTQ
ncbi:YafY family protein [Paenibacillus sp. JX-17]|uniref:YafY family protein n=1 Tax=Paenibacillus lacisoli TaxID=3064525 RepID=A0ABT9CFW3_9BACL|nr:YafY family protein [Paenibacillus sp. JX-17]MDO7908166.1 YafY family protein [Paenibacillus sp. JX-17]